MKNKTSIKVSKKQETMIAEIWRENDGGELSYWAATEDGYCFLDMEPGGGCHTAHEDTQKAMKEVFKSLAVCDCEECRKAKVKSHG